MFAFAPRLTLIATALSLVMAQASALAAPTSGSRVQKKGDVVVMKRGPQENAIVVTGQRPAKDEEVRTALRDLAMRGRTNDRPIARFQGRLCVNVFGLGDRFGREVKRRIESNANEAGLQVERRRCKANAVVVVVRNPDYLIEQIFTKRGRGVTPEARREIQAAQRRGDVAVSWSIEELAAAQGGASSVGADLVGAVGTVGDGNFGSGATTFNSVSISRIRPNFILSRTHAMVVFDVDRLARVHLNQLADFATMRLLTDPQPVVQLEDSALGSILTLFDVDLDDAAPHLTSLDRAYLKGLYKMRPNDPGLLLERFVLAAYKEVLSEDFEREVIEE